MSTQQKLLRSFTVKDAVIVAEDNGHLRCDEDKTYWCAHIEFGVRNGLDVEFIWNYLDRFESNEWLPIEVPMVPNHNQWAAVHLSIRKIGGMPVLNVNLLQPNGDDEVFLGFLANGEGRLVLRSMVYDWFRGVVDVDSLKCMSRSHKFVEQMKWQDDMKDEQRGPAQLWSVWQTGNCLSCTYDASSGIDDLIPDAGKNPWGS